MAVRHNTYLYHLFVIKRFQGQGLATHLCEVAKTANRGAGNPGLFTVTSSRYAINIYETKVFVSHLQ